MLGVQSALGERALYAPAEEQKETPEIKDLIQKRTDSLLYKDHSITKT